MAKLSAHGQELYRQELTDRRKAYNDTYTAIIMPMRLKDSARLDELRIRQTQAKRNIAALDKLKETLPDTYKDLLRR